MWHRDERYLAEVSTMSITEAIDGVKMMADILGKGNIRLFIEDARKRKWYGETGRERLKGAGSICRDCTIWEDFCREQGLEYRMMAPSAGCTKLGASQFKALTKWQDRTSNHARDAAMLVFWAVNFDDCVSGG